MLTSLAIFGVCYPVSAHALPIMADFNITFAEDDLGGNTGFGMVSHGDIKLSHSLAGGGSV